MTLLKKILKWSGIVIVAAFVGLVIVRMFVLDAKEKTAEQVARIHDTKLKIGDVMGENLPPVPSDPDSSIQGVDANGNGIRDDVELAIFKEYPNSAKTRAVLLQYALALQMEVVQPIVNTGTVTAVAQVKSKASKCIGKATSRDDIQKFLETTQGQIDFIDSKQINNKVRDDAQKNFYNNLGSYSSLEQACDLDLSTLPN